MVTQEELSKMSPDEIAVLQKQNCIFCQIVDGKVSSKKVYEDDKVLAILDINPANPGHILLLTKEHYMIMPQVPDDITGHLFMVAKALSQVTLKALNARGSNLIIANGLAAGQRAPHFMMHIIPRAADDKMGFVLPEKELGKEDHEKLKKGISEKFNSLMKITKREPVVLDRKTEKLKPDEVEAEFKDVGDEKDEGKKEDKKGFGDKPFEKKSESKEHSKKNKSNIDDLL